MKKKMIKAGIIGASGYTGSELIRLLLLHPDVDISFVNSSTYTKKKVSDVFNDLIGETELVFSNKINNSVDVIFLCSGHKKSIKFLAENNIANETKIIDLSQDFRNNNYDENSKRKFIYGLPEINKTKISKSSNIANPGCFATAILLGLIPSFLNKISSGEVYVNAITGSTGAGILPTNKTHNSWRNNNISWYKPFEHQHLNEINNTINQISNNHNKLNLITYRGSFTRGIFCTAYYETHMEENEIIDIYKDYYKNHSFVFISENEIDLKNVINTNKCLIHLIKKDNKILITSVIDNLIKGASGQAIQNLNIMFGIDEKKGLKLKGLIY